jgi:hypothetical protein
LFLIIVFGAWPHLQGPIQNMLAHHPNIELVFGVPLWGAAAVVVITCLLAFAAGALYRFDMNLVYGKSFQKLDEIIAEMEELRN